MIESFADEITEDVFHGNPTHAIRKKLPSRVVQDAQRKLDILNAIDDFDHLRSIPANQTELVRDIGNKYSIPIYQNWRILFRWVNGPLDVEIRG